MKKLLPTLALAAMVSPIASAQVANGDLETWNSGSPTSWTTIDSGINVSQSTNISYTNGSSAAVTVNTGTQSSTDFRQSIAVTANQTYNFSARIYHTEGNVRARLYVNGYQGYSDNTLTNQWQEISFSYTATASTNIEVGLRFYDQSGFDGSEIVYVDTFLPTDTNSGGSGDGSGGDTGTCTDTTLTLNTDNYGYETSWSLNDSDNSEISSGSGYRSNRAYTESFCLNNGEYTFTINDSYGDGICCGYGNGAYEISADGAVLANGGEFNASEVKTFTIGSNNGGGDNSGGNSGGGSDGATDLTVYYQSAEGLTGYTLKTALHDIIKGHSNQGYGALWSFYEVNELDTYYENDGSILDIYSENPTASDVITFTKVTDQCGNYSGEGDCYNREHSFPKSWFGGKVEPMNSDVHHIFASDGFVNSKRSSYPYGEVGSASYTSGNGSKLGSAATGLGYTGLVFEPIDEFKGDLARAYFYMATRYQDQISGWQTNSTYGDAILDGSSNQVFEPWFLTLLKSWHAQDPVSQKETNRNNAAEMHQANRNPFVDHPEFVHLIWDN